MMRNKKIIVMLILFLSFVFAAEAKGVFTFGGQMLNIMGTGDGGNSFTPAFGGFAEIGFTGYNIAWVMGVGVSSGKNKAGNSSVNATFYPLYMDCQVFINRYAKIQPIFSFGMGGMFTRLPGLQGYVQDLMLTVGGGVRFPISRSRNSYFRIMAKPFFMITNKDNPGLEQKVGIEVHLGMSFYF